MMSYCTTSGSTCAIDYILIVSALADNVITMAPAAKHSTE